MMKVTFVKEHLFGTRTLTAIILTENNGFKTFKKALTEDELNQTRSILQFNIL